MNYNFYKKWGKNCSITVKNIKKRIKKIEKGNIVIGYGAAAKANTFLNFSKIKLDFIIDDNPLKQNKYCPGSKIPIKSKDILKTIKEKIYVKD